MFNPIDLARETEKIVRRNLDKRYYRFRGAKFYGGIATADVCGCCLRCKFCWSWNIITNPIGSYYSPSEVANKLIDIAEKNGYKRIRISGGEPTICKEHLLSVLDLIPKKFLFILETNGILIDEDYAKALSKYKNLHVRVSIKADTPEMFERITGAEKKFFDLQLNALKNLCDSKVSHHPSLVTDFCKDIDKFKEVLKEHCKFWKNLELEELIYYPHVEARLRRFGLKK